MIPFGPEFILASELMQAARNADLPGAHEAFAFHDESILGTHLRLLINTDLQDEAFAAAHRARAEIDRLDQILNWRSETSELSNLNRSSSLAVSADLYAVIAAAERWKQRSNGAYSGRLGLLGELWRASRAALPDREQCARLAEAAHTADVGLDPATRTITRPDAVKFDLDGLAKGYIIDRALDAALGSPAIEGALLDIGGDIRAAGAAPGGAGWIVGLPDPLATHDNAALVGRVSLRDRAIATSGCGPRDRRISGAHVSQTLDPRTGWPVPHQRSATAIAASAADADALATALLTLPHNEQAHLVKSLDGAVARLADPDGANWITGADDLSASPPALWTPVQSRTDNRPKADGQSWHEGWSAFVTFQAPPRQKNRDRAFRSPYVAIWMADMENRPVRTLVLIGSIKEWQEDNYIWWGQHRSSAQSLLDTRSMSTRGSGQYRLLWDGIDESAAKVPPGKYVLHIETSRERGRHTHRSLELDFTKAKAFTAEIPTSEEAGGVIVSFEKF